MIHFNEISEEIWIEEIEKATDGTADYAEIILMSRKLCPDVDSILLQVDKYKPKAVIIDGGYRLDASKGGVA